MSMLDRYLYEEEFEDRSNAEINRILIEHKSPEFIEQYKKLLDKKNKTGNLKDNLEFYAFTSQKIKGKLNLHDLLNSNLWEIPVFYLTEIAKTIKPNEKIGDIGCGAGLIPTYFAELYPDTYLVGVDISESLLMRARKRAERRNVKNIDFVRADMDHLYQQLSQTSLRSSLPFDRLICLDTINESIYVESLYEKKIENRLKEFEKVSGRSGKVNIGMAYHFSKRDSYDLMKDFYEKILGSVFSLENMLSREIRTRDGIIYTAYLFNVKVKS